MFAGNSCEKFGRYKLLLHSFRSLTCRGNRRLFTITYFRAINNNSVSGCMYINVYSNTILQQFEDFLSSLFNTAKLSQEIKIIKQFVAVVFNIELEHVFRIPSATITKATFTKQFYST